MKSTPTARLPGFYKLPLEARLAALVDAGWLSEEEAGALASGPAGGFDAAIADGMSENVIGIHGLPLGVCLNLEINGEDRVAPMAVEEPSVVAAASNAARLIRSGGGFSVETTQSVMAAQVQITGLANPWIAAHKVTAEADTLVEIANAQIPNMVRRGGGARDVEARVLHAGREEGDVLIVHILVDCLDAMGANLLNTVAEGVAPHLAALTGGTVGLRILTNFNDRRLVRVSARVAPEVLRDDRWHDGGLVRDRIVDASRFAETDPYRAVTHNKGFMNGLDAVLLATGQDWRAAEAAAHAWAARHGVYGPLATWRVADDGFLEGHTELPLAVGVVGGAARAHPGVRLGLKLARVKDARDLAGLAAAVGLASNLAALKALATDGIQRGHMALHARTVAIEAGATGDLVHQVAARLQDDGVFNLERAREILAELGGPAPR